MKKIILSIKKHYVKLFALSLLAGMSSCELDYRNTEAIDPEAAWGSETMIQAYLTNIYDGSMPGWNFGGDGSDESIAGNTSLSDYLRGVNLSVSNNGTDFKYEYIDRINYLLDELPNIPESILPQEQNNQIKGQALFWRAWRYWSYVKDLGGVPLILHKQDVSDMESLFVKRSSTSECMDTILADLDQAISLLPEQWTGNDYGRIDRCAALAFKGRVLLWYASPLFNRNNDPARWKVAYDANKEALDACLAAGHALMTDFSQIWLTDGKSNTEAIMFKRYTYPDSYYNMWTLLPEPLTNGYSCQCIPMLPSVLSFPLKDGSSIAMHPKDATFNPTPLDTARLRTDAAYNAQIKRTLITGMDPRFYASISLPGTTFPSKAIPSGQTFWSSFVNTDGTYKPMLDIQYGTNYNTAVYSSFYPLKAVTPGTDKATSTYSGVNPWIEIRLAEVYMNLAECANEVNSDGHDYKEALEYIALLRKRAGIEQGSGDFGYGLDRYASQAGVRHLLINERLAEFNQEGKRFGDLRRWMRFDIINNEKYCSSLFFVYNGTLEDLDSFDWTQDMKNESTREQFYLEFVYNVKKVEAAQYNITTKHWFDPIGLNTMAKNFINDQSQQNNEWGGTFDPLK